MAKQFAKAYLEITNTCNLSCSFCHPTLRKKRFLSCEEFRVLAQKLRDYTDFLYLHVLGEPLLHPELQGILEIAGQLGFSVVLTTNGTLLPQKQDIILQNQSIFKVSVSLHSFEANVGGDFDTYLNGCLNFCDAASRQGIISVLRLWNGDADQKYAPILLNKRIVEAMHCRFPDGEWAENTKGIRIRKKLFVEYGERFNWREQNGTQEKINCYALRDQIGVLCDGTVVPCCIDCEGNLALGNLFKQNMEDILAGDKAKRLREGFLRHEASYDFCKQCGFVRTRL